MKRPVPTGRLPRLGLIVCLGLSAGGAGGQLPEARHSSRGRRFVVIGQAPASATQIVVWADQLADRFEEAVGLALPPQSAPTPVLFVAPASEGSAPRAVVLDQGWVEGRLRQRVRLDPSAPFVEEQALEIVTRLLLNQLAAQYVPEVGRSGYGPRAPDWLAAGLGRHLTPGLRARDHEVISGAWLEGLHPRVGDLLGGERLAPDDPLARAAATEWVGCFLSQADSAALFESLLRRLALELPLTPAWIAEDLLQRPGRDALEREWEAWLAHRQEARPLGTGRRLDDWLTLERARTAWPEDLSPLLNRDTPVALAPEDLLRHQGEDWLPALARTLRDRVLHAGLGRSPAFAAVCEQYARYFDALAAPPPRFGRRRVAHHDETLTQLLIEARALETSARAPAPTPAPAPASPPPAPASDAPPADDLVWERLLREAREASEGLRPFAEYVPAPGTDD